MDIIKKIQLIYIVTILLLIIYVPLFSQDDVREVIISEVYLNKEESAKSWIEISNLSDQDMIIERLRISHIRAINVLPPAIRKQGGIKINAGECLVLCSNREKFISLWGKGIKVVEVKTIANLASGGFIAISVKNHPEHKGIGFRYGNPRKSAKIESLFGKQVLKFSVNDKSYSRKIIKSRDDIKLTEFVETIPTPGYLTN